MALLKCLVAVALLLINSSSTDGHGRLMDPVNRGSAFRKGFPTPENYDDDGNYCGGFMVQYEENNGKCGVCGDNYADERPRANENGGKYGTGVIVKTYISGSVIVANVEITANHLGHFTFDLCPLRNSSDLESEECFGANKLELATGGYRYSVATPRQDQRSSELRLPDGTRCRCFDEGFKREEKRYEYEVESSRKGEYLVKLRLPEGLTCEQCVLRWQYTVGNSWGVCDDGIGALGCGNQETFRTCSDIRIV